MSHPISFSPVAYVKSMFDANTPPEEMRVELSQLVFEPEFVPGLLGLKAGMDIVVVFHFSRIRPDEIELQLHPRHNPENPLAGVFATRTQFRPNGVATTVAQIKQVAGNVVTVTGLDALNGTPVLDIKPWSETFDTDTRSQQYAVHKVDSLQEARDAIDLIDAEVVRLLGNRAKYVHQVVKFKKGPEEVPAKERYNQVMQRRRELAQENGLNPDVIEKMYIILVDNFIKEELEIMRQRENNG